jgi:hypothetical protein
MRWQRILRLLVPLGEGDGFEVLWGSTQKDFTAEIRRRVEAQLREALQQEHG